MTLHVACAAVGRYVVHSGVAGHGHRSLIRGAHPWWYRTLVNHSFSPPLRTGHRCYLSRTLARIEHNSNVESALFFLKLHEFFAF